MADGSVTIDILGDASEFLSSLSRAAQDASRQFQAAFNGVNVVISEVASQTAQELGGAMDDVTTDVEALSNSLSDVNGDGLDSVGEAADGLSTSVEEAGDSTEELYDYIQQMEEAAVGSTDAMEGFGDAVEEAGDSAENAGDSLGGVSDDIDGLRDSAEGAGESVRGLGEIFKGTFLGNLAANAVTELAGALKDLAINSVQAGMDFTSAMSQVGATMGMSTAEIQAGSESFELLEAAAKDAGATTAFSATQAAEALNYLALAGYDATTAADTLPAVLNLAAAGGMDLAYASDLATDAMSALGIEAGNENLTHFGDEMAMTASKANTSVAQLGEAILTVGGTAKGLAGGTVGLNTALGILANNGIKGAEGGTALRNVILSLSAPTDKAAEKMKDLGIEVNDAQGNMRPLNDIFQDFNASLADMSESEKTNALNEIFNKVDLKSVQALLSGAGEGFDNLSASIENSGGAMQNMADVQLDNLQGDVTIMQSALEGLQIAIYDKMEGPMRSATQTVTGLVSGLQGLITGTTQVSPAVAGLGAALAAALVSAPIAANIGKIVSGITSLGTALKGLNIVGFLTNPATLAVTAIAALVGIVVALNSKTKELSETEQILADYNADMVSSIDAMSKSQEQLVSSRQENVAAMQSEFSQTEAYLRELRSLTDENGRVKEGYEQRAAILADYINNTVPGAVSAASDESGAYYQISDAIDELIFKKKQEALINAYMPEYEAALKNQVQAYKDVSDATYAYASAQERVQNLQERMASGERGLSGELREAQKAAEEAGQALQDAQNNLDGVQSAIDNMNALQAIDTSQGIAAAMQQLDSAAAQASGQIVKYTGENTAAVEQALGSLAASYQNQAITVAQGWASMTEAERQGAQQSLNVLRSAFDQQYQEAIKAGVKMPEGMGTGIGQGLPALSTAANEVMQTTLDGMRPDSSALEIGIALTNFAKLGIENGTPAMNAAGTSAVASTKGSMDGAVSGAGFEGTGSQAISNTASGMTAAQNTLFSAAESVVTGTKGRTDSAVSGANFQGAGTIVDNLLASGISSGANAVLSAVKDVVSGTQGAASSAVASLNFSSVGNMISQGIASGIRGGGGAINMAVRGVVGSALLAAKQAAIVQSPSKLFRDEVGQYIGLGIAVGISNSVDEVNAAASDVIGSTLNAAKSSVRLHSRDFQSDIGGGIAENIAIGIEVGVDSIKKAMDTTISYAKSAATGLYAELDKIQEAANKRSAEKEKADYEKRLQEKYDALGKAEKDEKQKILDEIAEMQEDWNEKQLDAQEDAAKKLLEGQIDALEDLADEYESSLNDLLSTVEDMAGKLGDVTLFEEDDFGKLELFDLQDSIDAITAYGDAIEALKSRGISESLFGEVLDMDMEDATKYANALLKMTDDQYNDYIALWEEKERKAQEVAKQVYAEDFADLQEEYKDKLSHLPDDMGEIGGDAMDALNEALKDRGGAVVTTMRQIADDIIAETERINAAAMLRDAVESSVASVSVGLAKSAGEAAERRKAKQSDQTIQYANIMDLMNAADRNQEIVLNLNGREVARAMVGDLRAVEDQSPRIVSD